jgi:hypothetical protein
MSISFIYTWSYSACSSTVLNMEKCEIGRTGIDFLGHHITAEEASPITRHVEVIQQFPRPLDKKQLQSFLGLVNFYRRFIPAAAQILLPLTDALPGEVAWTWTPAMDHSFGLINSILSTVATLTHPDPAAELCLAVGASNTHVGAQFFSSCADLPGDLSPSSARSWTSRS